MAIAPHSPAPLVPSASFRLPRALRAPVLAALSGLLLVGAFPHLDQGWLAWFALVPFLLTFPHRGFWGAASSGLVLGVAFYGGVLYWLALFAAHALGLPLGIVAWLIGTLAQTSVIVGLALGMQFLRARRNVWAWRLGVPALWTILEWVRQLGMLGTGWGDLAYTQHSALPVLQTTKLAGVWGLTFLIVLVNVAVAEALRARRASRFTAGTAAVLLAALVYGAAALRAENLRPTFAAAALQGNINQDVPRLTPPYVARVMDTYSRQARQAAAQGARVVVWPETMFPGYLLTDPVLQARVQAEAVRNRQALLIGGNEYDSAQNKDANAMFVVNARGQIAGVYEKRQLVPWGEYVPFRKYLTILEKLHLTIYDRKVGAAVQPLLDADAPVGKVGVALCYESSYGSLMREQVARGAGLLVISTDDTWFGRTAAARQHTAIAAVRAAESDRYLVRCAATGVSQVIAPTGRVLREADLFRAAVVAAPVQSRTTLTPYARWGDWFIAVCGLLLAATVGLPAPRRG